MSKTATGEATVPSPASEMGRHLENVNNRRAMLATDRVMYRDRPDNVRLAESEYEQAVVAMQVCAADMASEITELQKEKAELIKSRDALNAAYELLLGKVGKVKEAAA